MDSLDKPARAPAVAVTPELMFRVRIGEHMHYLDIAAAIQLQSALMDVLASLDAGENFRPNQSPLPDDLKQKADNALHSVGYVDARRGA